MAPRTSKPLVVQEDKSVLLEVQNPWFEEARDQLMRFAELRKSPRYVHVYQITPLSLWNAAAIGLKADDILGFLKSHAKYPVPLTVRDAVRSYTDRYGEVSLTNDGKKLLLRTRCREAIELIGSTKSLHDFFCESTSVRAATEAIVESEPAELVLPVRCECRGPLKIALTKLGYPVNDLGGYHAGAPLQIPLRQRDTEGRSFRLRPYQKEAVEAFYDQGRETGGSGVVVLPCGAGKTVVALGVLQKVGAQALILSTNTTALRQWKREIISKTALDPNLIGEYSGDSKEVRPITLSTYQILTYRDRRTKELLHYKLFTERDWGLIVYDEAHLLPAPVFRFTARIQATRRLGLTATLVREDGCEDEVFSLVGPKKYDVPWRSLESDGWIAAAGCVEARIPLAPELAQEYAGCNRREQFRLASENPEKTVVVKELLAQHPSDRVLILGQYLDQLEQLQLELNAPLITGKTSNRQREILYDQFRRGEVPVLIVSKVGNFAVDLPDASVAIQVSGTFGSRQEEAQRLGRVLRPKPGGNRAVFYSIVSRDTSEQRFAEKRQRFLTEQGYQFTVLDHDSPAWSDAFRCQDTA